MRAARNHIREKGKVVLLDSKFMNRVSASHPTSALHELCTRLGWMSPQITEVFSCGPPMMKSFIFKVRWLWAQALFICLPILMSQPLNFR